MIRYFAEHPTAANMLMIIIIFAGVVAAPSVRRETFPRFLPQEVGIEVVYPGAGAADVEDAVCARIEDALQQVTDLKEVRCEALDDRASAVAEMSEGGEMVRFLNEVKTEIEAIDNFPRRAEKPVVRELHRTDFVASIAITGPMSQADLKAYAEAMKDRLLRLPQVSQIELRGFSDHQLRIAIPKVVLRRHGLSVNEVAEIIGRQSVDLPAGNIETAQREVRLRFQDERRSPSELASLVVIAGESGGEVRLGDIATITDRFEDPEKAILFNGKRAAVLEIDKTPTEDSLRVVEALQSFIDDEVQRVAPGLEITLAQDVSSIVRDRLFMLVENGLQGLLLVMLAMWLFFSLRFSFWVAAGLPVSFLGTIMVMSVLGYSMNMITMTGLLMAIGLLLDDAIVISENIAARLHGGQVPIDAVVEGTRQVAPGVFSSFVTTAMVFLPLGFLSGDIGTVLEVMPVVLLVTLAVSLIEAFLILPHHLVSSVGRMAEAEPSRFRLKFERGFDRLRAGIGHLAEFSVKWRYPLTGLMLFALLGSGAFVAGGGLKFQAFPDIDGDVVEARLLLPQGTPLAETERMVQKAVDALMRVDRSLSAGQPDASPLVENVQVRFGENADAYETGPHVATIIVDLLTAEVRNTTLEEFYAYWRREIGNVPGAIALTMQESSLGPEGRAFEIRLQGQDLKALQAAALELKAEIQTYSGPREVMDDLRSGKPEKKISLAAGATSLGLDGTEVANQLRAAFLGETASEIQVGAEAYEIEVRQAPDDAQSLQMLNDFTVSLPGGGEVPLAAVADIESARGWARIHRIDGLRTVTVTGNIDPHVGNAMEIMDALKSVFLPDLRKSFPGVDVEVRGQASEAATTGASVQIGFVLGLIGIFVVLAFQFRSYVEPVVVMMAIPLAALGAVWGHVLMGYPLSMPSLVGAASLAGIVVNDSILLVQFAKSHMNDGIPAERAGPLASRDRFRAVLLTSVTTILGLLPLLAEASLQAQVLKPLVISVVFGLLTSTVLILFFVPALYCILSDFNVRKSWRY